MTDFSKLTRQEMYNHDQNLFLKWLDFKKTGKKLYLLSEGLGDNYMFKQVITPEKDAIIATCFPELWKGYNVISIGEAEQLVDKEDYSVYAWAQRNKWKGHLKDAYVAMYKEINQKYV